MGDVMKPGRQTKLAVAVGIAVVVAALAIGGVAVAAGGSSSDKDLSQLAAALRAKDTLTDAVAKELGTTGAKLRAAIAGAASDRIDAAEKSGSITSADADTIRAALVDDSRLALRVAQGTDVAKQLGVTEAKLDEAWGAVLKAQALARIDQAVKDGWITEKVAEQMRERIQAATFPGFGAGGHGFGGHGPGGRGLGGPGHGPGFGDGDGPGIQAPAPNAPSTGTSSYPSLSDAVPA